MEAVADEDIDVRIGRVAWAHVGVKQNCHHAELESVAVAYEHNVPLCTRLAVDQSSLAYAHWLGGAVISLWLESLSQALCYDSALQQLSTQRTFLMCDVTALSGFKTVPMFGV